MFFSSFFYIFVHEPKVPATELSRDIVNRVHIQSVLAMNLKSQIDGKESKNCTLTLARHLKEEEAQRQPNQLMINNNPNAISLESLSASSQAADTESLIKSGQKKWYHWFKSFSFWKLTTIYTFTRMFINVSQVYMPIYLQQYLLLPKVSIYNI